MGLEASFNYIDDLNTLWPIGSSDFVSAGDNHLRGIKSVLTNQFPNLGSAVVNASAAEINYSYNVTPGTAAASKALVLDGSLNISGVNQFTATTFVGALTGNASTATSATSATTATTATTANGVADGATDASGNFLVPKYAKIYDSKTTGTNGGSSVLTTWTTRDINTEEIDADNIVTISANQFTLGAGTYRISVTSPFAESGVFALRLRNITDSTTDLLGPNCGVGAGLGDQSNAHMAGQFTIAGSKAFEIQYWATGATATYGLGRSLAGSHGRGEEIYTVVEIWQIA